VVGLHHARTLIRDDDLLIVDGTRGVLIVNPDERCSRSTGCADASSSSSAQKLKRLKHGRRRTLDGEEVQLHANIELPQDVEQVREVGADGIGLFRTEFLFLNRDDLPDEDEQFEAYRSVGAGHGASRSPSARSTSAPTRRCDGARAQRSQSGARPARDPLLPGRAAAVPHAAARHPARLALRQRVRILIPMLASSHEIEQTLAMIDRPRPAARTQAKFDEAVPVGGMIEIPPRRCAWARSRRAHFLSIGTNDLIQYTLAIDRTDEAVAHLYDPLHPAVLRLIHQTIQAGAGRHSGGRVRRDGRRPAPARLLLGMGLRQFSMHPAQILEVKQEVLRPT
jgi:phosphotransferase system enzyme I (PtsI)